MIVTRSVRHTARVEEAEELFRLAYPGGGLQLSQPDRDFGYRQHYVGTGVVSAVQQSIGARVDSVSDETDLVTLAWTVRGENLCSMGSRSLSTRSGMLWSGRRAITGVIDHASISALTIARDEFERRAALLPGRDDFVTPDFVELPTAEHLALARGQVGLLRDSRLIDPVMSNELMARTVVDHAVAVVLAAAGLDRTARPGGSPAGVRRAVADIEENLARPIGVADIAGAAGMSVSGLTHAFQRELGEAPGQRIRRLRLARARAALIAADSAGDTVAAIARRSGFTHLGRFARDYRGAFGEAPNATLRA